jgi:HTH-type transcriptional regulator / antitoxin HigA
MKELLYKVVKNDLQYRFYCRRLEGLINQPYRNQFQNDQIDLLTVLVERYESEYVVKQDLDPIQLLRSLMKANYIRPVDLVRILNCSKGLVSDILNYKRGLSKESIRILSAHFKLRQEALNRPYALQEKKKKRIKAIA